MKPLSSMLVFAVASSALVSCAKREGPLPGDSISSDGGVLLATPRLSTAPCAELGAIESRVFAPEFIMEHQGELGIEPTQRETILHEVEQSQAEQVGLHWELQGQKEQLAKILDGARVDEQALREAASRLMDWENRVKLRNLTMLVRVKNALTPAQQQRLRALRPCG